MVFDKGNNSEANIKKFSDTKYHFVGSLKLNEMNELLDIPLEEYEDVTEPSLQGVRAFSVRKEVMGYERTVLITYNEELFLTQSQCILREIRKRTLARNEDLLQIWNYLLRQVGYHIFLNENR
ncbi:MAG TPA: hypothetical protein ENH01_00185 [Nitrospirae bacterium]|nr:hypothetical protein [Nitrospirota bacterium]